MIEDLGIAAPADVGYYSGMVDSSFSFAQLLTVSVLPIISPLQTQIIHVRLLPLAVIPLRI